MKKAIFAGTFDPFTVGHCDTVIKALALFDEVIISVAENPKKKTLLTSIERKTLIEKVFEGEKRVRVLIWEGAIVDLLKQEKTPFYVRGVRNASDFEYETADFYASRDFDKSMIELYIPSEQAHLHISSSLVKNCIAFHKPYRAYVPKAVYEFLEEKLGK